MEDAIKSLITNEDELLTLVQKTFGLEVFTPGLLRSKPFYEKLINELQSLGVYIVTIAGTNGKGETAHALSYLLTSIGVETHLWTSPHIYSLTERFCFNGQNVSFTDLKAQVIEAFSEAKKLEYKISFYEFFFLVFLKLSLQKFKGNKEQKVLILEVGLGGRLDAVNHLDANLAIITSISRDHKEILGNRFDKILYEKMGIIRKDSMILTALPLQYLRENFKSFLEKDFCGGFQGIHRDLFAEKELSMEEDYSIRNKKLAFCAFKIIGNDFLKDDNVKLMTFEKIQFPTFKARSEEMTYRRKKFIFIGAHNLEGMRVLVARLLKESFKGIILASFSKRDESESLAMLKMLADVKKARLHLTSFNHPKAMDHESLSRLLTKLSDGTFEESWKNFLKDETRTLQSQQPDEPEEILVTGSYYFIGEVQKFLNS